MKVTYVYLYEWMEADETHYTQFMYTMTIYNLLYMYSTVITIVLCCCFAASPQYLYC